MSNELLYLGSLCLLCVIGTVVLLKTKLIKVETEPNKIVIFLMLVILLMFALIGLEQ
ncbi:hypothetical protein [Simonsiella muelleri]|uniref:hypothetical protein n=1 Tax=Simonsiella muelleri TaxID=72 RepID=UPI0023F3CC9B|nr:hypothetical protein [Simonsiella muelleri]